MTKLGLRSCLLRIKRRLGQIHNKFSLVLAVIYLTRPMALSQTGQRLIYRDTRQPSREWRSTRKLAKMLISPDVRILHYVLGLTIVAKDSPRNAIQALVVSPHDYFVERGV